MSLSSKNRFDDIVVGAGLSGLVIASFLKKKGRKVALFESSAFVGGSLGAPAENQNRWGWHFYPAQFGMPALKSLAQDFGVAWPGLEAISLDLVTCSQGEQKPFVGFGDKTPENYSELSYFLSSEKLPVFPLLHELVSKSIKILAEDIYLKSQVTSLLAEQGKVTGVVVNGAKNFLADRVIYTGALKDLSPLLTQNDLASKPASKMSAKNFSTSVTLEITFSKELSSEDKTFVLWSQGQEDSTYVVGQFEPWMNGKQKSNWISFLSPSEMEDVEAYGPLIKKMKRQIRKLSEDAMDYVLQERILVHENVFGFADLKLSADFEVSRLKNLMLGSSQVSSQPNLAGSLDQLTKILGRLELEMAATPEVFVGSPAEMSVQVQASC